MTYVEHLQQVSRISPSSVFCALMTLATSSQFSINMGKGRGHTNHAAHHCHGHHSSAHETPELPKDWIEVWSDVHNLPYYFNEVTGDALWNLDDLQAVKSDLEVWSSSDDEQTQLEARQDAKQATNTIGVGRTIWLNKHWLSELEKVQRITHEKAQDAVRRAHEAFDTAKELCSIAAAAEEAVKQQHKRQRR
jgi:hypothetical protein